VSRGDILLKMRFTTKVVCVVIAGGILCIDTAPASAQVPPRVRELEEYSGLHLAAALGDAAETARLIEMGADVNARDGYERTPLHVATFFRRHDVIGVLAKAGADLGAKERDRYDAVTIAAVADDVATLRVLLDLGASAKLVTSRHDGTALIAAAHLGHDEVVKLLIQAGAPLNHVNNLGWTALIESIVLGKGGPRHSETLRALVRAGANVNLPDRDGMTPRALAWARGYWDMVRILENAGAR
jgi:ankyrin repeat protein